MKKLIYFALLLLFASNSKSTSAQLFQQDKHNFSIGYGAGNFMQAFMEEVVSFDNSTNLKSIGPLFVKYEYAIDPHVGIGVNYAYMKNTITGLTDNNVKAELSRSTYSILARVNFHMGRSEVVDPYIGIGFGLRQVKWNYSDEDNDPNNDDNNWDQDVLTNIFPLGMDLTIGMRVHPVPEVGFYLEIGAAKGIVQGGVSVNI